jgi:catechol 2,3-dioxygenase-like lactoylglutathione lyase family enzyme
MLSELPFFANIPVADLDRARALYEGVLGMHPWRIDERIHEVVYEAGPARFAVYVSAGAGKSEHTIGTFVVKDMDPIVAGLRERGVDFIDYDLPGLKTEDGLASFGYDRVAWFKDPDGNILALTQEFTVG